jgi:hypothetical protein
MDRIEESTGVAVVEVAFADEIWGGDGSSQWTNVSAGFGELVCSWQTRDWRFFPKLNQVVDGIKLCVLVTRWLTVIGTKGGGMVAEAKN